MGNVVSLEAISASGPSVPIDERRENHAGEKIADADLIGIPVRVVIRAQSEQDRYVEVRHRGSDRTSRIGIDRPTEFLHLLHHA